MGDEVSWRDNLPETIRGWDEVKNSDTPDKFWGQMEAMRAHMGRSIRIPGEDAPPEDMTAFNQRLMEKVPGLMMTPNSEDKDAMALALKNLGAPDEAAGYSAELPEQHQGLKELAQKYSLTRDQFGMVEELVGIDNIRREESAKGLKATQEELKTEWGAAHDERMSAVKEILQTTGAPEAILKMAEAGELRGDAAKWVYNMSQAVGKEGVNIAGQTSSAPQTEAAVSPEEATIQLGEVMRNPAYFNNSDPMHKALVAKALKLQYYASGHKPPPGV